MVHKLIIYIFSETQNTFFPQVFIGWVEVQIAFYFVLYLFFNCFGTVIFIYLRLCWYLDFHISKYWIEISRADFGKLGLSWSFAFIIYGEGKQNQSVLNKISATVSEKSILTDILWGTLYWTLGGPKMDIFLF